MQKLTKWYHTKSGLFVFVIIELALAYGFASLSIDRGNLWWYLLTFIFLIFALQNLIKLIGKLLHHGHKTTKA